MIYLAVVYGGSYDDCWQETLAGSTDKAKVEAFVTKIKAQRQLECDILDAMQVENEAYQKINPLRERPKHKDWPRWNTNQPTAEMRAERQAIKDENAAKSQEWQEYYEAWDKVRKAHMTAWVLEKYTGVLSSDGELMVMVDKPYYYQEMYSYSIEEAPSLD